MENCLRYIEKGFVITSYSIHYTKLYEATLNVLLLLTQIKKLLFLKLPIMELLVMFTKFYQNLSVK